VTKLRPDGRTVHTATASGAWRFSGARQSPRWPWKSALPA